MMTIKTRFANFTRQIRPTLKHMEKANQQTDYMVNNLKNRVAADGTFTLEKILRAGSNAKHTSLRQTADNLFDVDLGAYYSGKGATKDHLDTLLDFTQKQLRDIYPMKAEEDFEILKSAVRVKFKTGIKLWVDVAPIIRDDSLNLENGGWIPRADGWRLTSVTLHNRFVSSRSTQSNLIKGPVKFNRLVRLVKWWNNRLGDLTQPSIFCDLICAAAVHETGVTDEWRSSLLLVFSFLRKHQFLEPILFGDNYTVKSVQLPDHPVIVMDSVNSQNNVASLWTEQTRIDYLDQIQDAYDAMMDARSAERDGDEDAAVDAWCRVFGEQFRTLSEQTEEED